MAIRRVTRVERAIGVIYRPETELASHYFQAVLPEQFDEYVWFDETTAITPFETKMLEDLPDTYPFGLYAAAVHHRQIPPARRGERTDRSRVSDITVVLPPGNPLGTSSAFPRVRVGFIDSALTMALGGIIMLTLTGKQFVTSHTGGLGSRQRTSDGALTNAIAAGDRHAMHVLCVRHSVRVYRFVLRLTNDSSLAEDLVTEVFIDVWRGARGFKAKSQVSTWLLANRAQQSAFGNVGPFGRATR